VSLSRVEASTLTTSGITGSHGRSPLLRLQSDERLIALVRRGNHSAFEVLVGRYQSRLLAFCRHMLGSREDAEDVLQEVFAAAFNAILADERPINARPWLYRIARNRSLNHLRRVQPIGVDSMDIHLSEHGTTTADKVDRREQFRELIADVQQLPETQRTALLLREIDALSYEQIAEAMETTIPSVKSLLVRARVSLAEAAEARQLSCDDVRMELGEIAEGLRRRTSPSVRRHLRSCERCTVFRTELRATSKALALMLPVGPLLLAKKLLLAHVSLSSMAGGGAGGAASAGGALGVGTVAGSSAGAAGGGGLISAGLGALGAKAAAGIAAAALVTAGAVEIERGAPHHVHAQPQVVAQRAPHHPIATPVVQPAPARVQRTLEAPVRATQTTRRPAPADAKRSSQTTVTQTTTAPAPAPGAAPAPADTETTAQDPGRTQVETGATTFPATVPSTAPPPTLIPAAPPAAGTPATTTPAPPPSSTTTPPPASSTTPTPPPVVTPPADGSSDETGTGTTPAPPPPASASQATDSPAD
jgi:RNA polymerase sigma factor (sigma-70 family)